jgi:outer membrane protein assembly factor BamB
MPPDAACRRKQATTLVAVTLALIAAVFRPLPAASGVERVDVVTYHNDAQRTGWNARERLLTAATVASRHFGLLWRVPLDGREDAQPLLATAESIGGGTHDALYLATENDSLYAVDAKDGAVLWMRSLGTPVPDRVKGGNTSVFPVVGILGTPVIDRARNALYCVADTFDGGIDAFVLHAVSLTDGSDLAAPATIAASAQLSDGTTWTFDARVQFQRPGLLEAGGGVYVAFGSNSDVSFRKARGLLLRYDAATLQQTGATLTNSLSGEADPFYLSSIWQSGYAPALGDGGAIFATTGNSNPFRGTYSRKYNHPEGVLKFSSDLSRLLDSFTPSNYVTLDEDNADVGSGGTMVVPDQGAGAPRMVVAGGKDGRTFLLDADHMGGFARDGTDRVLAEVQGGPCWCGPAYFAGSDGVARIVTGGALGATAWRIAAGGGKASLAFDSSTGSAAVQGLPENGGVIPAVSSNGEQAGTAIVWFVQRPQATSDRGDGTPVTLRAYDAMDLTHPLFAGTGGHWRHAAGSNANIVPTIAEGKVFVASDGELRAFGLRP